MKKILLLSSLLGCGSLPATTLTWTNPVTIDNGVTDPISNTYPVPGGISLNDNGVALISWFADSPPNEQIFSAYSTDFGQTWMMPQNLTAMGFDALNFSGVTPPIPVNQNGKGCISWKARNPATDPFIYASYFSSDSGWATSTQLDGGMGTDVDILYLPCQIGSNNYAVTVWSSLNAMTPGMYDLKSATNNGSGWSAPTMITATIDTMGSMEPVIPPTIALTPDGTTAFAYWIQPTSPTTFDFKVARSDVPFNSWGTPNTLGTNSAAFPSDTFSFNIIVKNSKKAIAEWVGYDGMNYSLQTSSYDGTSTWSTAETHTTSPSGITPLVYNLAANSSDQAALSWGETISGTNVEYKARFYNGSSWETISSLGTFSSTSPPNFVNVSLNDSGTSLLSFMNDDGSVYVARRPAGSSWETAQSLSSMGFPQGASPIFPSFCLVDNQNVGWASWIEQMGMQLATKTATYSSGQWQTQDVPGSTSTSNMGFFSPSWITVTSDGKALLNWGQEGSSLLQSSTATFSGGPLPPSGGSAISRPITFITGTIIWIVIIWIPSTTPGVTYTVTKSTPGGGGTTLVGTTTTPTITDPQVIPGQMVTYSVTAVDSSGNASSPLLITITPPAHPNAPCGK